MAKWKAEPWVEWWVALLEKQKVDLTAALRASMKVASLEVQKVVQLDTTLVESKGDLRAD